MSKRPIWKYPWGYSESFVLITGFMMAGVAVQLASGTKIHMPGWPFNIVALVIYVCILSLIYFIGKRHPLVQWLSSVPAAIAAIGFFTMLSLLMGFIPQSQRAPSVDILADVKHSWLYLTAQLIILTTLGLTILRRTQFKRRNIGFLLNHFGLWIVLAGASFGSGDIERYTMTVDEGGLAWTGIDDKGVTKELPVAIELHDFSLSFHPPEAGILDKKHKKLTGDTPLVLESGKETYAFKGYHFAFQQMMQYAWLMGDTFREAPAPGAVIAAQVIIVTPEKDSINGWISQESLL